MNYEQDIRIDNSALDVEWLEQAALFMKYARHSAQTMRDLDEAKQALDVVKAELDLDIREHPEEHNVSKVTEGAIQSAIILSEKYKKSFKVYLESKFENDMASKAINAMNQRKEALENLVRLHSQSYFAGPKIPRDLAWERDQKQKKANAQVGPMIRRNK
jgi:hypothetical protein